MAWRFKVSPAAGAAGLYSVPTVDSADDAPLTDPLSNLSRVVWHPALRYPGRVRVQTGSITLGSTSRTLHTLFAHGMSYKPLIKGTLTINGVAVPWCGSVPMAQGVVGAGTVSGQTGQPTAAMAWLTLGADETNVYAFELTSGFRAASPTITYTVHVFDRAFETPLPNSGPTRLSVTGGEVVLQSPKGSFTTAKRYMRGGSDFYHATGKTIGVGFYNFQRPSPSTLREIGATVEYNSGTGYSVVAEKVYYGVNTTTVDAPTVSPSVVGLKI